MDRLGTDHDPRSLELQARSLEALVSLLHALNASNDVDDVAKRALLTVSGQLLARRAAFFVQDDGVLHLRATIGVGRTHVMPEHWTLPREIERRFDAAAEGVIDLAQVRDVVEVDLSHSFDRIARLENGSHTVGVLLLGGWLGSSEFDEGARQLLRTMGVVIGTTLHRVSVHEQLLRAQQRLEQANVMRKSVIDHVSHEFNTPLMVIKSAGELLRDASEDARDALFEMHDASVRRLEQLVGSILSVVREIEDRSPAMAFTVQRLVDEVVEPWRIRSAEECIRGHLERRIDRFVTVDARHVDMILDVLYRNALDARCVPSARPRVNVYVAPRGWWEQQDHTWRLGDRPEDALGGEAFAPPAVGTNDAELVIEIVDRGRGIPAEDLEHIFEPFAMASNAQRLGISGAGIGLTTALRLAENLHGALRLQSRVDQGTIAAFILPARASEEE